jgi:diguanylate cyclase (GGDEF)-like protein
VSNRPAVAGSCTDSAARYTATLEALLASSYRLSSTMTTAEAADELASTACALMGADGAHVHLPEELGGSVWSNANEVRTGAARGTVTFDVNREAPDLIECMATGEDLFVADGLGAEALRRPLRARLGAASLWFVPLLDVGVLVLWWEQPRVGPPPFAGNWLAFITHFAQALRRRMVTTSLRGLTRTDPLTGLDNRRALLHVLGSLPAGGGLMMIDLDNFKQVNDTHGHRYGDQALQTFARLLGECAPHARSLARYGGEEFAVVFEADGRSAGELAFTALQEAWRAQGMAFSAGLAEHRDGARGEETLEAADRALYHAKKTGRDRLVHAPDVAWSGTPSTVGSTIVSPRTPPDDDVLHHAVLDHAVLEFTADARFAAGDVPLGLDGLDEALRRGLVTPFYQPVVDTITGRVVGVEALARITHPTTGALLLPAHFLPLAERTGRVRELDRQVADASIAQVAVWRRDPLLADLRLAVNISVDHLDDVDLSAHLSGRCRLTGLPTHALTVEITETLQSVTGRQHENVVHQLRDVGLHVALDDFGTGFSTLSYLLRFPVTAIKIDRSFTSALTSERGRRLVRGILTTALDMGLSVVAEGVETAAQRDWLTSQGCPYLQGYLFSPPVPSSELPTTVRLLSPRTSSAADLSERGT